MGIHGRIPDFVESGLPVQKPKRMDTERRKFERFKNSSIVINVARPGITGFFRLNPTAECLNFSLSGMQLETEQRLNESERLIIDIFVDQIELHELDAEVRSCKKTDQGYRCGINFCLDEKRMQRADVRRALLLIEDKLKNSIDLALP